MDKKNGFEDKLKRLEQIVAQLESGELSLEDSLKRFEEGTRLVKQAGAQLAKAEQKMRLLTKDGEGRVTGSEALDDLPEGGGDGTES